MFSPSPTSSVSSSGNSSINRNGPQQNEYIKSHKNISFSFAEGTNCFQQGQLGDNDTFLVGTLHLNYQKSCHVKSVHLHFKGIEKTSWYKSQARAKYIYSGENTLVDQSNKIWEAFEETEEVTTLDVPFKVQIPYNLPDTIKTEIGSVQYILRAAVNTKSIIGSGQQVVKLECPLRRTLVLDNHNTPPHKLCGQTPSGIDYTFILPPNKCFNLGTYASIPMKLQFLQPNVGIEKIEVYLRTSMDFQSTTQGETKHVDQQITGILIPRSELRFTQPSTPQYHGECTHTINLFIPKNVQPTHQGRFICIAHFLSVKFCLWGFETDFNVKESVRIANIIEKQPFDVPTSSTSSQAQALISPEITPPLTVFTSIPSPIQHTVTPPLASNPSPIQLTYPQYSPYIENNVPNLYYHNYHNTHRQIVYGYQSFENVNRQPHSKSSQTSLASSDPSRSFYDKVYDGYNAPQQPLNYNYPQPVNNQSSTHINHINGLAQSEHSSSSRTSTPSIAEDSPNIEMIATQLSPPPYRQPVTRQISEVANHYKNVEHSNK